MAVSSQLDLYFEYKKDLRPTTVSVQSPFASYEPKQVAIIGIDMWKSHWSPYSTARAGALESMVNGVYNAARNLGIQIIHSPSDCAQYYLNYPQLSKLNNNYVFDPNRWTQVVRFDANTWVPPQQKSGSFIAPGTWQKRPWLTYGGGPQLYEDLTDEDGQSSRPWSGPGGQSDAITIEANDLMVIDNYKCPNAKCPGHGQQDGHFHLAQYCYSQGIKVLLYVGLHTNWCVVFSRPYSLWPMSSFRLDGNFVGPWCSLVRDMTEPFIHPIAAGHTHYSGKEQFLTWLMDPTGKDPRNEDGNNGVYCSTVSVNELLNFDNNRP